ncbi:MAG: hypothetical protein IJG15_00180, partial [Lachnospiraceae bacterium]|nr:hypothetical protein [Lachnospiraceae bacterium]
MSVDWRCSIKVPLSDHAGARKCAGIAKEKFVKTISLLHQMEVCAPSQTSGVKKMLSSIFFTL